jgi:hypothetical protein
VAVASAQVLGDRGERELELRAVGISQPRARLAAFTTRDGVRFERRGTHCAAPKGADSIDDALDQFHCNRFCSLVAARGGDRGFAESAMALTPDKLLDARNRAHLFGGSLELSSVFVDATVVVSHW